MKKENIGSIISNLRKEKNMTQIELGKKLNVTDKAVSKWERGISCPDINTIPQLAEILGISPNELMGYTEKSNCDKQIVKKENIKNIISLILKSVGMSMGIASLTLLIIKENIANETILTMLSIGVTCFGIVSLSEGKEK
ncbi:helix-turn-helix domain-containing protein [Brassicibacter mesophilus]|uniref:helix-turn-helix domain-containing protein n=1 Tax=Brassicibacter mesophilus TaxID=745119 RepID=UPI003D2595F9